MSARTPLKPGRGRGEVIENKALRLRSLPVIPIPADVPDDLIDGALRARGIPHAVYDFIKHNLGTGAALAACLSGTYQRHEHNDGRCCG